MWGFRARTAKNMLERRAVEGLRACWAGFGIPNPLNPWQGWFWMGPYGNLNDKNHGGFRSVVYYKHLEKPGVIFFPFSWGTLKKATGYPFFRRRGCSCSVSSQAAALDERCPCLLLGTGLLGGRRLAGGLSSIWGFPKIGDP